jgi:hypothetical protein
VLLLLRLRLLRWARRDRCVVPFAVGGRGRRILHVFGGMVDESKIATESRRSFLTSRLSFFTGLTVPSNAPAEFSCQASSTKSPPACKHLSACSRGIVYGNVVQRESKAATTMSGLQCSIAVNGCACDGGIMGLKPAMKPPALSGRERLVSRYEGPQTPHCTREQSTGQR